MAGKSKESPASERIIREFRRATADSVKCPRAASARRWRGQNREPRPMLGARICVAAANNQPCRVLGFRQRFCFGVRGSAQLNRRCNAL